MKKSIAIFCLLSGLTACEVLEQTPEATFTPANFYKNADDAKAAVSTVYDPMNTSNMYNQVMWIIQDQSTDDAEWGGGRQTANQPKNDLDKYTFTPATNTFQSLWTTVYQGINRANTVTARGAGYHDGRDPESAVCGRSEVYARLLLLHAGAVVWERTVAG